MLIVYLNSIYNIIVTSIEASVGNLNAELDTKKSYDVYKKIDFANLLKYDYGFFLDWGKEEDAYKNEHQVFTWHNGTLLRHYLDHGKIKDEEYMYLHYWCRPTTFAIKEYDEQKDYLIYADTTTDKPFELTPGLILKRSRRSKVKYYAKVLWFNRKKITWERIVFNVKGMLNYKK